MPTVLFLCVANSARSQMAEGIARHLAPAGWRFLSAGSAPSRLHSLAVTALREDGIDISGHRAKGLDAIDLSQVDTIVTLCAEEVCPVVPVAVKRLHWPLIDPSTPVPGERQLDAFRAARDRLMELVPTLWNSPAATSRG